MNASEQLTIDGPATEEVHTATSITDRPVKVLLIDDRPIVGEAVRRLLINEADILFHYCSDPKKAIKIATEIEPTVILLDLVMPEIDGLVLLRFFRRLPVTRDIPIVMLSTKEEAQLKAEAFANGANDYLVKLPDKIELIARVRYHSTAYVNLLKRHEAELTRDYNKKLEKRVEERTHELKEALQNLQKTQTQLVQSEKMSGLGQLVAGIAHEINNPVNFISGNLNHVTEYTENLLGLVELYQKYYPNPVSEIEALTESIDLEFIREDLPKITTSMKQGSDRISDIVQNLRNFSRMDEAELKRVNIHEGIDSTVALLQHRLKETDIEIIKEYSDLPLVECYAGQLNQVFMNILTNAIDALDAGKKLHQSSENEHHRSRIEIRTAIVKPDCVTVKITDNGPGILPEVEQRIFDPFFTTKEVGQGKGLGLSISYQIVVEQHKGVLHCVSKSGQRTEFWIEIPVRHNKIRHLSASTISSISTTHTEQREIVRSHECQRSLTAIY